MADSPNVSAYVDDHRFGPGEGYFAAKQQRYTGVFFTYLQARASRFIRLTVDNAASFVVRGAQKELR